MTTTGLLIDRRQLLIGAGGLSLPLLTSRPVLANSGLPTVQALLDQVVASQRLPGLVVGVQTATGGARFIQSGYLDFDRNTPANAQSLARLYSLTKLITGAATALLIEDGRLGLDQTISDFIPELAQPTVFVRQYRHRITDTPRQPILVRHLLTHTAGFAGDQSRDSLISTLYRQAGLTGTSPPDRLPSNLDEFAQRLGPIPLQSQPGSGYDYGLSFDLLGLVIQRASGMAFPDFVQNRLLDPLGMADTRWQLRVQDARRLMALYRYGPDQPPESVIEASAQALTRPVTLYRGGSGLLSSASDYLAFMAMLLKDGSGLMQPQTARLVRSDLLPPDISALGGGHGFGGWVARPGHARAGEFGWSGNASTQAWLDPVKGFCAVLMMQALPYRVVDVLTPLRAALDQDLGFSRP